MLDKGSLDIILYSAWMIFELSPKQIKKYCKEPVDHNNIERAFIPSANSMDELCTVIPDYMKPFVVFDVRF